MSMLFGMYEPASGEIFIRGEKVNFRSSNDASAHNIGMVHQHFKPVNNYTVAENIVLGIEPMKKLLGILPCVDMKAANQQIAEQDKGVVVLLISLELDEIMELADTIGVIYNGQLLKIADASTMASHDVGKYMMG